MSLYTASKPSKPWYTSKTHWLNIGMTVAAILLFAVEFNSTTPIFREGVAPILLFIAGIVNIIMRQVK